jgi:hypothetical protein
MYNVKFIRKVNKRRKGDGRVDVPLSQHAIRYFKKKGTAHMFKRGNGCPCPSTQNTKHKTYIKKKKKKNRPIGNMPHPSTTATPPIVFSSDKQTLL